MATQNEKYRELAAELEDVYAMSEEAASFRGHATTNTIHDYDKERRKTN